MKQFEGVTWLSGGLTMGFRIWWHAVCLPPLSNSIFKLVTSMETLVTVLLQNKSSHQKRHMDGKRLCHTASHCVFAWNETSSHELPGSLLFASALIFHTMQMMWRVSSHRLGVKTKSAFKISIICHLPGFFSFSYWDISHLAALILRKYEL